MWTSAILSSNEWCTKAPACIPAVCDAGLHLSLCLWSGKFWRPKLLSYFHTFCQSSLSLSLWSFETYFIHPYNSAQSFRLLVRVPPTSPRFFMFFQCFLKILLCPNISFWKLRLRPVTILSWLWLCKRELLRCKLMNFVCDKDCLC